MVINDGLLRYAVATIVLASEYVYIRYDVHKGCDVRVVLLLGALFDAYIRILLEQCNHHVNKIIFLTIFNRIEMALFVMETGNDTSDNGISSLRLSNISKNIYVVCKYYALKGQHSKKS